MSKWVVDAEHFAGYAKAWLNPFGGRRCRHER